jgi:hypothetical protein
MIDFRPAFYAMFAMGFIAAGVIFWVIPKLWHLLKPLIHSVSG